MTAATPPTMSRTRRRIAAAASGTKRTHGCARSRVASQRGVPGGSAADAALSTVTTPGGTRLGGAAVIWPPAMR